MKAMNSFRELIENAAEKNRLDILIAAFLGGFSAWPVTCIGRLIYRLW